MRNKKKLLDKRMWYRREKGEEDSSRRKWKGGYKNKGKGKYSCKDNENKIEVKSVVFIQQTKNSKLLKRL